MLVIHPEDYGLDYDERHVAVLAGLSIKARLLVPIRSGFVNYAKPAGSIVEVVFRAGKVDAHCEYSYIAQDGFCQPVGPSALERVPDDTPLSEPYSPQAQTAYDQAFQRANRQKELKAYAEQFIADAKRGIVRDWDFPD